VWAGVDSVWEQEKLETWKMLENAAGSHGTLCWAVFINARYPAETHKTELAAITHHHSIQNSLLQ
jgi:hypothetical protein